MSAYDAISSIGFKDKPTAVSDFKLLRSLAANGRGRLGSSARKQNSICQAFRILFFCCVRPLKNTRLAKLPAELVNAGAGLTDDPWHRLAYVALLKIGQ